MTQTLGITEDLGPGAWRPKPLPLMWTQCEIF